MAPTLIRLALAVGVPLLVLWLLCSIIDFLGGEVLAIVLGGLLCSALLIGSLWDWLSDKDD